MAAHQALLLRHVVVAISSSSSSPNPGRHSSSTPLSQSLSSVATGPTTTVAHHRRGLNQQQQQHRRRLLQFPIDAVQGAILGVEPDLDEDYIEGSEFKTAGEDTQEEDFPYGKLDGAHSFHKGDDNVELLDFLRDAIKDAGGPSDNPIQATISWLFLPAIFSGLAFGVQPEYLFLVTVLFIFAFIGVEMAKPSKPSNFEYDANFPGPGYKP